MEKGYHTTPYTNQKKNRNNNYKKTMVPTETKTKSSMH